MRGRPFVKGKSGNPGGRPHVIAELRDLGRRHAPDAIKELGRLALKAGSSRPALPPSVSCLIAVAVSLLDFSPMIIGPSDAHKNRGAFRQATASRKRDCDLLRSEFQATLFLGSAHFRN
jgi:hypothetical protein